jgi:aryl-alcohol dehydrogenase-like predicted oxidoreductase
MTRNATGAGDGTFSIGGDLPVRRLGFGAMRLALGTFGGPARDPQAGIAVLRRAAELGVNHIDTAGFYGWGGVRAHELIREALSPYPADLVIATKVGPLPGPDGLPSGQAAPDQLRDLVEDDLRRLGLNRLDLVYLRVGGLGVPGGESVADRFAVLAALRDEGLIRHLGLSNIDSAQFAEARSIAPVAAIQNHHHIQHQDDSALLAQCAGLGIAYVPFFPLGGGNVPLDPARLEEVCARYRASSAQVALAWLLAASPVTLAIPGTGSLSHLEENMAAARLHLTAADLRDLKTAPG